MRALEINVAQQLKEAIGSTRNFDIGETCDLDSDIGICEIQGRVRLLRTDRGILASVTLTTKVGGVCSRCLSPLEHPLTIRIEEEYFPSVDISSGAPIPQSEEASGFTIDHNHVLDLTEAVRQYILLNMPMKPLCREDCAGLCPHCGANLNRDSCYCERELVDPRWSKLQEIARGT